MRRLPRGLLPVVVCFFSCDQAVTPAGPDASAEVKAETPAQQPGASPGSSGGPQVGSTGFYLELAGIYERYRDFKTAAEHYAHAEKLAPSPAESIQVHMGLARVQQLQGDRAGAAKTLERVLAAIEKEMASSSSRNSGGPGMPREAYAYQHSDAVQRLGNVLAEQNKFEDAASLYEKVLARFSDSPQRDFLLQQHVSFLSRAGKLDQAVAQREKANEGQPADEPTLRFLMAAYQAAPGGTPAAPGAQSDAARSEKLIGVLRRLGELRPADPQIRQSLQAAYERAGRVDDAIALVRTHPVAGGSPGTAGARPEDAADHPQCRESLFVLPPINSRLASQGEVVRIYLQSGKRAEALAETGKLMALGSTPEQGVQPYVMAARLYAEQAHPELSDKALAAGKKAVRAPEQRRALAIAEAELLMRVNKAAELKALYEQWKKSDDACLRAEGTRRLVLSAPGAAGPGGG